MVSNRSIHFEKNIGSFYCYVVQLSKAGFEAADLALLCAELDSGAIIFWVLGV